MNAALIPNVVAFKGKAEAALSDDCSERANRIIVAEADVQRCRVLLDELQQSYDEARQNLNDVLWIYLRRYDCVTPPHDDGTTVCAGWAAGGIRGQFMFDRRDWRVTSQS